MSEVRLERLPVGRLARPERVLAPQGELERALRRLAAPLAARLGARDAGRRRFLRRVSAAESWFDGLDAGALAERVVDVRRGLQARGLGDRAMLVSALALLRVCARHALGLRPHDEQLLGARLLLQGRLAEMATGEGKSLTAALAAGCAALAGVPVHLVTVNGYLAARDAEAFAPFYRMLGLRSGGVLLEDDEADRRSGWNRDVVYCDSKVLVFDYLRDQLRLGRDRDGAGRALRALERGGTRDGLLLRGLHFALVDEADSVLIDEARTPLILSGPGGETGAPVYRAALELARRLRVERHFSFLPGRSGIRLTPRGEREVERLSAGWDGLWRGRKRRRALVVQALMALHGMQRERDYLVEDGAIRIVDPHTGRVLPDRQWSQGLHQLVELKEGLRPSRENRVLARISYQRFFRRYHHLCGLSGTAREVAGELWRVYGLRVTPVPTHRPVRRRRLPPRVFSSDGARLDAAVELLARWQAEGRAVLAGCDSVAASEAISRRLTARGVPHRVLNARQSREEAELVARAGRPGSITVTTQMAGRGTDIRIAPEVRRNGGLHVLLLACQEARRIDRQLEGRCARQGDPGTVQYLLSWEDALVRRWAPFRLRTGPDGRLGLLLMRGLQWRAERAAAEQRKWVQQHDEQEDERMAYAGGAE